jgi:hypothetical protein
MAIKNMVDVSVVVDDLGAAVSLYTTLAWRLTGEAKVEGPWMDQINRIERY